MNKNEKIETQLFFKNFTEEQLLIGMEGIKEQIEHLTNLILLHSIFEEEQKVKLYNEMKSFYIVGLELAELEFLSR